MSSVNWKTALLPCLTSLQHPGSHGSALRACHLWAHRWAFSLPEHRIVLRATWSFSKGWLIPDVKGMVASVLPGKGGLWALPSTCAVTYRSPQGSEQSGCLAGGNPNWNQGLWVTKQTAPRPLAKWGWILCTFPRFVSLNTLLTLPRALTVPSSLFKWKWLQSVPSWEAEKYIFKNNFSSQWWRTSGALSLCLYMIICVCICLVKAIGGAQAWEMGEHRQV